MKKDRFPEATKRGVLLIVDPGMFAEALGSVLAGQGVEIVGVVHRPDDVADVVAHTRPSVVLIDMDSRFGRRLDVVKRVRKEAARAKVIALVSESDGGQAHQAAALGFHGVLNKDADTGALVTAIRRMADGEGIPTTPRPRRTGKRWPHERHDELLISQLTPRELEVIRLMATAASSQEIARRLAISVNTVRSHIQSIFTKLQVHTRIGAVAFAAANDLLAPPSPNPSFSVESAPSRENQADRPAG